MVLSAACSADSVSSKDISSCQISRDWMPLIHNLLHRVSALMAKMPITVFIYQLQKTVHLGAPVLFSLPTMDGFQFAHPGFNKKNNMSGQRTSCDYVNKS